MYGHYSVFKNEWVRGWQYAHQMVPFNTHKLNDIVYCHIEAETKLQPFHRRHFQCIFLNENVWISLSIWLKIIPKVRVKNIAALVQIMAWCRPGDKPLFEPMMVSLLTHICGIQPIWVIYLQCWKRHGVYHVLSNNDNRIFICFVRFIIVMLSDKLIVSEVVPDLMPMA